MGLARRATLPKAELMLHLSPYRDEFPVTSRFIYLNHAATGPLPRRSAAAIEGCVQDQLHGGGMAYRKWLDCYAGLRDAAARLIHAEPREIALTKNTSEGLSFLANGIAWRPGDIVVGVEGEFPANYFPWKRLERRGVQMRWVPLRDGRIDLDELDRACEGARLLAVSYVQYLSGFRLDLDAAGEICRRRGARFVVDAVQGLGPFPVDVRKSGIHALSASGHKWLLGPEGAAIFYIAEDWMPEIEIVEFGWTNVQGFPLYSREEKLRLDAGRFEGGTLNTLGCFGLRASIELHLEVGVDRMAARVHELARRVLDGARARGYRPCAERSDADGSGIVSLKKDGVSSDDLARELAVKDISVASRHGYVRVSPHFYHRDDEIDAFLAELP